MIAVASLIAVGCGSSKSSTPVTTAAAPTTTAAATTTTAAAPTTTAAGPTTTAAGPTTTAKAKGLLPDNGPCSTSQPEVVVSIQTTFESPVLSLKHQVQAAEASVAAFNKRGGVGGRCMKLMSCDDKADPNAATDCARSIIASKSVASVNDTTSAGDVAVKDLYLEANYPRVGLSPGTPDYSAAVSYNLGGGGLGTTFEMIPPLLKAGKKNIAAIHVDLPAFAAAVGLITGIIEAGGGKLVADIPVPAGTTNYDQFILSAEQAGADGIMMPLGDKESIQVMKAASGLGSKLAFSVSLGTFNQKAVQDLGDLGKQMVFNAEVPPATVDPAQFPAMKQILDDLGATNVPELKPELVESSSIRSWLAVYAFVTVMGKTDVANITRESVTTAFNAATDIDMLGLQPKWTPNKPSPGVFTRISNPTYYFATWDGKNFKTSATPEGNLIETLKPTGLAG